MSGDLGGQECSAKSSGTVCPIQRWGNVSFTNSSVWALVVESSGNHMKLWAMAVRMVQVSFIWGSWLQKYKVLKLGNSLENILYIEVYHIQYSTLPVHCGIIWTYSYRTVNRYMGHSYEVSASENKMGYSTHVAKITKYFQKHLHRFLKSDTATLWHHSVYSIYWAPHHPEYRLKTSPCGKCIWNSCLKL
jgi:hypothetical protein